MTASRTIDVNEAAGAVERRATRRIPWPTLTVTVFLVMYAVFMATRFVPALSEPDDNGYFAQGSLLAETGRTWFTAESDAQYVGMHWLLTPDGKYVSRYPPGLAVLIAGVEKVAGWRGAALVNPVMALAGLVGFYLIGRRVVGAWWAVAGVVLLGAMPEYMHHGLGFDSHTAVAFCAIWGLYFLLRWWDERKAWQAFAAGLVLGCIPTVRYPDVVMGLGVAAFLLVVGRGRWRHVAAAVGGAMLPVAALAVRNHLVMGAFWRTGYALTHEQTGFSWGYFREHAIDYVRTLNASGVGPVFALGVVGMVWMIANGGRRRWLGVMLAGMTVPMVLLYMAYYWAPGGGGMGGGAMTMRFMVPTFAAYVLAGVWAVAQLVRTARPAAQAAVGVTLVGLQLLWGTADVLRQADRSRATKEGLVRVTEALERTAGRGSVVVADPGVLQHLDYVREWKLADASLVRGGGGGPGGMMRGPGGFFGGPPPDGEEESERPSPRQAEKDEIRRAKYDGSTRERQGKFAADLVDWAGGAKVYLVGSEQEVEALVGSGRVRVVGRVKLPEEPTNAARGGGVGRGGMMGGMRGPRGMGMRRMGGGMFGGPGGPGGGPPMGGGPGIMGGFWGLKEVVIAEWMRGN